ncbi:hypothetical protein FQN53_007231 [Emmonsiellopsis sp. PD_33]|nr:hypothetical protein FQN53_007231 [Emmonsiellopsis sp. PD_33]KAK2806535.1 hypothetical protein FQN51_006501 [Onygenales sp. PD_10]
MSTNTSTAGGQRSVEAIYGIFSPRTFSIARDDYGKDLMRPLPLSLDRVRRGRASCSNSRLLRLPVELLSCILSHIPDASLASLALVNSDCRQLARSRQFASVCLNYSDASWSLVKPMLTESSDPLRKHNTPVSRLGACIRHLTVATSPTRLGQKHGFFIGRDSEEIMSEYRSARVYAACLRGLTAATSSAPLGKNNGFFPGSEPDNIEEARAGINEACLAYYNEYFPAIKMLLPCLPHLERLDWEDKVEVDREFFHILINSQLHHLKLFRIRVTDEFQIGLPKRMMAGGFPLRSLFLEITSLPEWPDYDSRPPSVIPLTFTLFRACAPALESLTWILPDTDAEAQTNPDWDLTLPLFQRLREFKLCTRNSNLFTSCDIISAFVPSEENCYLRFLSVDACQHVISNFLRRYGKIRTLERLEWNDPLNEDPSMDFLLANNQLRSVSLGFPTRPNILESRLLPGLASTFRELTSLRLSWKDKSISAEALGLLCTLKSLEQLYLGVADRCGWSIWFIDHQAIRETVSKLPRLKKLALVGDTYENRATRSKEFYYMSSQDSEEALETANAINWDERGDGNQRTRGAGVRFAWEWIHCLRMLTEADKYLEATPEQPLEWMYFGQLPMGVRLVDGKKKAYALFHKRDDCFTVLKKMFTWDSYVVA